MLTCSIGPRTAAKSIVCAAKCGAGRSGRRKLSSGGGPAPGRVFSAAVSSDAAAASVSSSVVCLDDGNSLQPYKLSKLSQGSSHDLMHMWLIAQAECYECKMQVQQLLCPVCAARRTCNAP